MTSKEQFLASKEISSWWASIAVDPRFDRVLLHACGVALEGVPSEAERNGALKFKDILLTLSDVDADPVQFHAPKINHDLDVHRRTVQPPEVSQPKIPKKK
jgi:hypothetical protein